MKLDMVGSLWIFIALAVIIAIGGLFMFFYFQKIHPKTSFMVYARNGIFKRTYRLYYGKVPTELDIFSLLLGKRPTGFPLNWFRYEFVEGKRFGLFSNLDKMYIGQFLDGRLYPLPFGEMLGKITVMLKLCSNTTCGNSNKYWGVEENKCEKCGSKLSYETVALDALLLQGMKYNPDLIDKAYFTTELDKNKMLPLSEFIAIYDVGSKIAEAMASNNDDNQKILDQNNPFITALIASLPLAIIMIGFGVAAYVMWQGMGDSMNTGMTTMKDAATINLKITEITYNTTKMLNDTGMLKKMV